MKEDPDFLLLKIDLSVNSEDEHEPFIERFNRTLKDRCRICFATLMIKIIPRCMIVELVYPQIF